MPATTAGTSAQPRHEAHVLGRERHVLGHQRAAHARLGVLARTVDVEHDHLVGQAQRGSELAGELPRARVQVGLEGHDDPTRTRHVPGRAQLGGHLRGVVGVVVVDRHPGGAAAELEPAAHPVEPGEPLQEALRRCPERDPGQQRGQRVERHVLAGDGQPQPVLHARRGRR